MKKWKSTLLPAILTVLILITGFSGTFIARKIIPDGIDTVKGYDKTAVRNKLITFDEPENLTLFPWNLYDGEKATPIFEFGDTLPDKSIMYLNDFIDTVNKDRFIFEEDTFKKIKIMDTDRYNRYIYIKDAAAVKESNNKKYLLNIAFDSYNNALLYYNLKPQKTAAVTPELKNEANEFISELISDSRNTEKYLNKYLNNFYDWNTGIYLPDITERFTEASYFFYQDEILLCFSGFNEHEDIHAELESNGYFENTEDKSKILILFYNIFEKEFTGFSLQY